MLVRLVVWVFKTHWTVTCQVPCPWDSLGKNSAISFSRGSSQPKDQTQTPKSPALQADSLSTEAIGKPIDLHKWREWNSSTSGWVSNGILSLMSLGDNWVPVWLKYGLPWWLSGKEFACNAGDMDSIPGLGRSPGEGNGILLQYSCQESSMDRGAWRATVHGVEKQSGTT